MRPLLLAIVLTAATSAGTEAHAQTAGEPAMRLAVVRKIVAPKRNVPAKDGSVDRAEEVSRKFEATLSSLGVASFTRADLTACRRDLACLRKLRAETGATHLLDLEATFVPDQISYKHSYTVMVSLVETASGIEISNKTDRCPRQSCTVPQMTKAIVDLVSAAVADGKKAAAAAPPEAKAPAPPPVAEPSPRQPSPVSPIVVATPRDEREDARRGRGFGWWLVGGGAAAAVAGGFVLSQNGLNDCTDPKNDDTCIRIRRAALPGGILLGVGGAAMLVGALDLAGVFGSGKRSNTTALFLGPSSVTLTGRF